MGFVGLLSRLSLKLIEQRAKPSAASTAGTKATRSVGVLLDDCRVLDRVGCGCFGQDPLSDLLGGTAGITERWRSTSCRR